MNHDIQASVLRLGRHVACSSQELMDPEQPAIELRRARSATMWKVIAAASAAAALAIALITTLRDDLAPSRHDASSDETQEPGGVETAVAARGAAPVPVGPQTATVVGPSATSAGADNAANGGATSTTKTTSATTDIGGDTGAADAAAGLALAGPAVVAAAPPAVSVTAPGAAPAVDASSDTAGTGTTTSASTSDAGTTSGDADAARDPWAPPSMSAGAGPFSTQAPYWGASAWVPDPTSGAGRFTTEAPPWSASALTSDPNAGAGPFTTEWNIPGFGGSYWPSYGPTPPR